MNEFDLMPYHFASIQASIFGGICQNPDKLVRTFSISAQMLSARQREINSRSILIWRRENVCGYLHKTGSDFWLNFIFVLINFLLQLRLSSEHRKPGKYIIQHLIISANYLNEWVITRTAFFFSLSLIALADKRHLVCSLNKG